MDENNETPELPKGPDFPNWELAGNDDDTAQIPPSEPESTGPSAMTPPPFVASTPPPAQPARRPYKAFVVGVVVALAAVLIGAGVGHAIWPSNHGSDSNNENNGSFQVPNNDQDNEGNAGSNSASATSAAVQAVASKISPSLVDINTNLGYQNSQAAGTGMVMTSNGLVLTNNHVINGATQITATDIGNGKTYNAKVVGYDRTSDIAVIQLQNASGLTVASFGNSNNVSVGQSVVGIGNAGGVGGTPSTAPGSVTALHQTITASDETQSNQEQLIGLIETNAPIQPGDSGGPLATMGAQVIGIDTAASSTYTFNQSGSQGFAIPINTALDLAHKIIAGQASDTIHIGPTGFLGVQVQANSSATNGISGPSSSGVAVVGTLSGSPAANAGLVQGDTITAVNGVGVTTPAQLTAVLGRYHPGSTVTLSWTDANGANHNAQVTLTTGPAA